MHKNVAIDNQKKRLPGNVTDYNETKYRVDVLDIKRPESIAHKVVQDDSPSKVFISRNKFCNTVQRGNC